MELRSLDQEMGASSNFPNSSAGARRDPDSDPAPAATAAATRSSPIRYKECLKNHAATMGGHVLDGCGEFFPGGEEGTQEALKCAACDCHRSFHRKEVNGESTQHVPNSYYKSSTRRDQSIHPLPQQRISHGFSITPPVMMAFGGGGAAAESSSEDLITYQANLAGESSVHPPLPKKRFRTKLNQEQKDKMMEFAEKLGWKMQKQDEEKLQQFCAQVGVKRKVFKVWMHNNKQAMKKKQM